MINLKVEEYCHNCPDFESVKDLDVRGIETFDYSSSVNVVVHKYETTLTCKYHKRCAAQMRYLQKQHDAMKKKEVCDGK